MMNQPTSQITELLQELAAAAGEGAQPGLDRAEEARALAPLVA
jgi:hypothetical protein